MKHKYILDSIKKFAPSLVDSSTSESLVIMEEVARDSDDKDDESDNDDEDDLQTIPMLVCLFLNFRY